jgi:bacteriochlorophyllide a dehydrogenase
MNTLAVVFAQPEHLALSSLELSLPAAQDVVVEVEWSGISTGTEKLLWTGRMPMFPGMGYPLVPGYESVGRVTHSFEGAGLEVGQRVFVPGARCYGEVRGLFGGAASRIVLPAARVTPVSEELGEKAVLLALAATAYHAVACGGKREIISPPELIIGHGVLGRLLARMTVAAGYAAPTVWETNPIRMSGALGYEVTKPEDDTRRDYKAIYDVSGDCQILDCAIQRLAPQGEVVLAGFYTEPMSFNFAPAFMREAQIRMAAEWKKPDMLAVKELIDAGRVSLDGLITNHVDAPQANEAYRTAFGDAHCLKMIIDWRATQ